MIQIFEYLNILTLKGIFLIRILGICYLLVIPSPYGFGFKD